MCDIPQTMDDKIDLIAASQAKLIREQEETDRAINGLGLALAQLGHLVIQLADRTDLQVPTHLRELIDSTYASLQPLLRNPS